MNKPLTTAEILTLPPADRLALIEALWDSLDDAAVPLPDWHRDEIDRRLAALADGASIGRPWHQVRHTLVGKS